MKAFLTILVLGLIIVGVIYLATDEVPLVSRFFKSSDEDGEEGDEPTQEEIDAAVELYRKADAAAEQGLTDRAFSLYEEAASEYPNTWGGREASLQLGNIFYGKKRYVEALDAFQKALPNLKEDGRETERVALTEIIRWLNEHLAGKPGDPPERKVLEAEYTVRGGDNFSRIARKFGISVAQIKIANNRLKDDVWKGEKIRITRKMPFIIVSKRDLTLELHFDGKRIREYPVGIGRDDKTPAGSFTIAEKQKDPVWHRVGKPPLPNNDPANILGSRWMTLISADGVRGGYGIHGTTKPDSVPGRRSKGCIRMLNRDVEELFEWVPTGTRVVVTDN